MESRLLKSNLDSASFCRRCCCYCVFFWCFGCCLSSDVGLPQHDIPEKLLREALDGVIEDCVSFVGVDLNVAGVSMLRYFVWCAKNFSHKWKITTLFPLKAHSWFKWKESEGYFGMARGEWCLRKPWAVEGSERNWIQNVRAMCRLCQDNEYSTTPT